MSPRARPPQTPSEGSASVAEMACVLLSRCDEESVEIEVIVRRVQQEFLEMPGLRLTPDQARKLWGLERDICQAVIDELVAAQFLCWTRTGAVMRLGA